MFRYPFMFLVALLASVFPALANAQTLGSPKIAVNDTWTYQISREDRSGWHQSRDEMVVSRVGATTIVIATKPAGSNVAPIEQLIAQDWSLARSVNGHQTTVNRPLAFPMSVGKSWDIDFTEDHPNRAHSSEHIRTVYKVVGWEDVTVAAGTFHALKIEADGKWQAAIAPALSASSASRVDAQGATTVLQSAKTTPTTATGHLYKAFWYVPEVKRWVKSVEETYSAHNIRSDHIEGELLFFKVD